MKANVVKRVIQHLNNSVPYHVGVSKPFNAEVDDECIAVTRIGTVSVYEAHEADNAAINLIVYAGTPDRAEIIAQEVSDAMYNIIREPYFSSCEEYSAYFLIDSAGKPTYRLNYKITYKE